MYRFFGFVSRLYTLTCPGRPVSAVFQGFFASTAIYFCNIDVGTYVMGDHVPLNPFNKLTCIAFLNFCLDYTHSHVQAGPFRQFFNRGFGLQRLSTFAIPISGAM